MIKTPSRCAVDNLERSIQMGLVVSCAEPTLSVPPTALDCVVFIKHAIRPDSIVPYRCRHRSSS